MGNYKLAVAIVLILIPKFLCAQMPDNIVLNYITSCSIAKGKLTIEKQFHIQINNEKGDWITDIKIPYQKGNEIKGLQAEIRATDGTVIRKLKKNEISDRSYISNISLYEDDYVKTFSLRHNQYPYQIYYSYTTHFAEFLWINSWTPVLNKNTRTLQAQLSVATGIEYPVKISQQNLENFQADTLDDKLIYRWASNYMDPVKEEIYAPSFNELIPKVDIVPVHFNYGGSGSHESWASYGTWVEKLSEGLNTLPISEQGKIHHLIKGITDPKEKVRILYNYMQDHTRYINVAMDIGGLKPYPASYVAANKYGDCKALTNYMKTLLEIADIPSYCVDVYAAANSKNINEAFPAQQFNHVILMVPLGADTIWLENTSNTAPMGYISSYVQNRQGLLIDGENSQLIDIPAFTPEAVKESKSYVYHLDEHLFCTTEIDFKFKGPTFELYDAISQHSSHQQKQLLEDHLPFKNFEIENWKIEKRDRNTEEVSLSAQLKLKNMVSKYDDDLLIRPQRLALPDFQPPEERSTPLRLQHPTNTVDSITLNIPPNTHLKKHLEPLSITSRFGKYSISVLKTDNSINFVRTFILNSGEYALNHYPEFYDFISAIKQAESKNYFNLQLIK